MLYGQLAVFGYFLYGFGPSVPLLGHDLALSDSLAALHGTAFAVGAVIAGLSTTRLAYRIGRTWLQRLSLLALSTGVCVYCGGTILPITLTGALVAGYAGNLVVNTTAADLSDHHGDGASAAISEANGISTGLGVFAPFALGLTAQLEFGWRPGLLVVVPLALGAVIWSRRVRLGAAFQVHDVGQSARERRLPPGYHVAWCVFFLCTVIELCMTFWASQHLVELDALSQSAATMTVTLMLAGMAGGRLIGARYTRVAGSGAILLGSLALNLVGFAVFWLARQPLLATAGIVVCGLGMAMQFPLTVVRSITRAGGQPERAMARIAIGEGIAAALGPFALGSLAERVGMHRAFLLVPTLITAAALIVALQNKFSK